MKRIIENIKTQLERCLQKYYNRHIPNEDTLTYWLETHWQKGNLCPPPMSAVEFENFLIKYLLEDKFCTNLSLSDAQTRTQLLHTILLKHSKEYKKEYEEHLKKIKNI